MKKVISLVVCILLVKITLAQSYEWNMGNTASNTGERVVAIIDAGTIGLYDGVSITGEVIDNNGNWGYNTPTKANFVCHINFSGSTKEIKQTVKTNHIILRLRKISNSIMHLTAYMPHVHTSALVNFNVGEQNGLSSITMGDSSVVDNSGELIIDGPTYETTFSGGLILKSNTTGKLEIEKSETMGGFWQEDKSFLKLNDGGVGTLLMDTNEFYSSSMLAFGSKSGDIAVFRTVSETSNSDKMIIKNDGSVGIGITSPNAKLHVFNGDNSYGTILANANESNFSLYSKTLTTNTINTESFRIGLKYDNDENNGFISFYRGIDGANGFLGFSTNGLERVRINQYGNVGIGATNIDSKLTVAGNIHAREVKVTIDAGADFVFNNNYKLPPLKEVSQFIKEHKHLPEIASEKQMQEEGLHLAEMNIKLLQKIEELTLYTIAQEKKIESQDKTNQDLKERLIRLEKLVLTQNQQ